MTPCTFSVYLADTRTIRRIDLFLTEIYRDASRSYLQSLIDDAHVLVNDHPVSKHHKLRRGDVVSVTWRHEPSDIVGEDIGLDVVYENEDFLVLNKDPRINVHPVGGVGGWSGTIVNALLHHFGPLSVINGIERPGIVHRLDKDTSGLMLVAKNDRTMYALQAKFAKRQIEKSYLAVVAGIIRDPEIYIESTIGRDPNNRYRMTIHSPLNPKIARTAGRVVRTIDDTWTLVEVQLLTGRTHQIRVHLASIGHPIAGDTVYGSPRMNTLAHERYGLTRQWLHAYRLRFELFGREYAFEGAIKGDLEGWWEEENL